ncbi:MAG: hypothetical protein EAZ92_12700 [Candidatus Kapaibacterium sp.]|nr:MAG: hypothetical protein EAZ92_12700 [Candidatus Kapabacteria bacterium]
MNHTSHHLSEGAYSISNVVRRAVNICLLLMFILLTTVQNASVFAQAPASTIASSTQASTQATPPDNDGIRYGFSGMFNYTLHNARFLDLPYISNRQNLTDYIFNNGMGLGFSAGAQVEFPLLRWLNLGVRASYVQRNGTLLSNLDSMLVGRIDDGSSDMGIFRRMLSTDYATFGSDVFLTINPAGGLNIYLGGRVEFAVSKSWQEAEYLLAPSDGVFHDTGERTRNAKSGIIPNVRNFGIANMNIEIFQGIGYEIPVHPSGAWTVEPSVFYGTQMLNILFDMAKGEYWNTRAVRGGLTLRYYPVREAGFDAQLYKVKQLAALEKQMLEERKKIQSELRELRQSGVLVKLPPPVGLFADGTRAENPTVRVEQFRSTMVVSLVPHVFFNEGSSVIPSRYRRINSPDRNTFSLNRLTKLPTLEMYRHLLNIIGKRMTERPDARLTLTAYNAASGSEAANKKLAQQRAETVSDYLQDVWKIPVSRISTSIQDASSQNNADKNMDKNAASEEDMRRVDIASSDPALLLPITLESVYQRISPQAIQFSPEINAGAGLKQWGLEVSQFQDNEIATVYQAEGTSTYPKEIVWQMNEGSVEMTSGLMECRLDVTDVNNRQSDAPIQAIPVQVKLLADNIAPNARVDIALLAAPLGKTLGENDVQNATKTSIQAGSVVIAEGFAERSDLKNENSPFDTDAADERARRVSTILGGIQGVSASVVSSKKPAAWMRSLHNDSGTPEGRLYNRGVRVEIRSGAAK